LLDAGAGIESSPNRAAGRTMLIEENFSEGKRWPKKGGDWLGQFRGKKRVFAYLLREGCRDKEGVTEGVEFQGTGGKKGSWRMPISKERALELVE